MNLKGSFLNMIAKYEKVLLYCFVFEDIIIFTMIFDQKTSNAINRSISAILCTNTLAIRPIRFKFIFNPIRGIE